MSLAHVRYHLILRVHDEGALLTPEAERYLHGVTQRRLEHMQSRLLLMNGTENHQHLHVELAYSRSLRDSIGTLKSQTTQALNRWGGLRERFAWKRGFAIFSASYFDDERLTRYIQNQKVHHAHGHIIPQWEVEWSDPEPTEPP